MVFEDNLDIILPPPHPQSPPVKKYIFCDALLEPLWQDVSNEGLNICTSL